MADVQISGVGSENTAPASTSLVEGETSGGTSEHYQLANLIKALIVANLTNKATPVAADELLLGDSEDSNAAKAVTLTALDTALRAITGVESGATADQTGAEIKSAYEGEADTNAFTDAEQTKLSGIETAADVTDATNVAAAGALMDGDDTVDINNLSATGTASSSTFLRGDNTWATLAGSGDVTKVGTPVDNQVGVWTGDGTLEGDSNLTFDGTTLDVSSIQARATPSNAETTSFTFALDDAGKVTTINNASATTATVPPNASVAFPVGTVLTLEQTGAGACTWTPGSGVTLNINSDLTAVTNGQYSVSAARKTATNEWTVFGNLVADSQILSWDFAISDETTALTTGTAKLTWRTPFAITLTDIKASVATAPTTTGIIIDVNDSGSSIMTTDKLLIDATETTTETASTPPALTDTALAADAEITFDIDQIGSGTAGAGAKVSLIGYKT